LSERRERMETLVFGLQVAVIGVGMVFVALIALIFIISLQDKILSGFTKKSLKRLKLQR
jgi:Na+-transporting methylmalonyl-CoA/oxaloacetate decarboxylase gamma subunit